MKFHKWTGSGDQKEVFVYDGGCNIDVRPVAYELRWGDRAIFKSKTEEIVCGWFFADGMTPIQQAAQAKTLLDLLQATESFQ